MRKLLLVFLVAIFVFSLTGCSKTNRFSIRTEPFLENSNLTSMYEDMLIKNGHSLNTEVPYDDFTIHLDFNSGVFDIDFFIYYLNTDFNGQEYEYTGYFCEGNDNNERLSCYTRNDEYFDKDYLNEQLEFSTILDTIEEYDLSDVLKDLDESYSIQLNQNSRIMITVEFFDNETFDFDSFKGIYYEEGVVIQAGGEVILDGYYLQYLYYIESGHDTHRLAYMKILN